MLVVSCSVRVVVCLFVWCLLFVVRVVFSVVCCSMFAVRCLLVVVRCSLCVVC